MLHFIGKINSWSASLSQTNPFVWYPLLLAKLNKIHTIECKVHTNNYLNTEIVTKHSFEIIFNVTTEGEKI